jgi:hypothetical protein
MSQSVEVSDTLSLSISTRDTTWPDQIVFTINGQDLRDLVGPDGEGMTGPPSSVLIENPDHFLGGPDRWEDADEPWSELPAMLGCGCGQPGCAAVLVRIDVRDGQVEWTDFQLDRDRGRLALGPFVFDRRVYEAALASLHRDRA